MEQGPRGLSGGTKPMSNINIGAREAVIASFARTPIGKAYRGAFNDTGAPVLAGAAIAAAVERAGINGAEVDDCIMGCEIGRAHV